MKNANDQDFFNFVGALTKGYTIIESLMYLNEIIHQASFNKCLLYN